MTILVELISVEVHGVYWVNRFVGFHRIVCDLRPNVTEIAIRARNSNPWLVLRVSDLPQSNRDINRYPLVACIHRMKPLAWAKHGAAGFLGKGTFTGCKIEAQFKGESRQHVVAHRRGGREVRLAQDVI